MDFLKSLKNGIGFECQNCGNCCSTVFEGYIFLYPHDIEQLLNFFKINFQELYNTYLNKIQIGLVIWDENLQDTHKTFDVDILILDSGKRDNCIFLEEKDNKKLCKIYEARPAQCKIYPFWNDIMTDSEQLEKIKLECNGFSQEITHNLPLVKSKVNEERQIERDYYVLMKENDFDIKKIYPF